MLAGTLLGVLAQVGDACHAFDHVEEERTAHRRRRRLRRIPKNVGDYFPLDGPIFIVADRPTRAYRGDGIHRTLHNPEPASTNCWSFGLSWRGGSDFGTEPTCQGLMIMFA